MVISSIQWVSKSSEFFFSKLSIRSFKSFGVIEMYFIKTPSVWTTTFWCLSTFLTWSFRTSWFPSSPSYHSAQRPPTGGKFCFRVFTSQVKWSCTYILHLPSTLNFPNSSSFFLNTTKRYIGCWFAHDVGIILCKPKFWVNGNSCSGKYCGTLSHSVQG